MLEHGIIIFQLYIQIYKNYWCIKYIMNKLILLVFFISYLSISYLSIYHKKIFSELYGNEYRI